MISPETAQDLANKIKSGQLPFDMKVISQETVGAELGANALPTSLWLLQSVSSL